MFWYAFIGFSGIYCEMEIDECESNPCHHNAVQNGVCRDGTNSHTCECFTGNVKEDAQTIYFLCVQAQWFI